MVLARKWRPNNFNEIIGQNHITATLKNAITQKKVTQAYFFTGPRGIGKTSCARILAKSLNCKTGPTISPCDACPSCIGIAKANSFDVIEIDGASNRGIDEIRSLRENVKYSPTVGTFKIYIIDEVHMLTTEAFNALLKTLEEPPEHVKFIFATTQPHKVISTIVSRCQRFDFRPISTVDIIKKLEMVAKHEKLRIEKDALFAIATSASGSMRDAESILEQLSAFTQEKIQAQDVNDMLGLVEQSVLFEIADKIAEKDAKEAIRLASRVIDEGKDPKQCINNLIEHFRNLMIAKVGGTVFGDLLDVPAEFKEKIMAQCLRFPLSQILDILDKLVDAKELSRKVDFLRLPLELTLAKLTLSDKKEAYVKEAPQKQTLADAGAAHPVSTDSAGKQENKPAHPPARPRTSLSSTKGSVGFDPGKPAEKKDEPSPATDSQPHGETIDIEQIKHSWPRLIKKLTTVKMSLSMYLQEGTLSKIQNSILTITFPKDLRFHKESLEQQANRSLIETNIKEIFEEDIRLAFELTEQQREECSIEDEPIVKSALHTFRGKMIGKFYK
ncbi:DNA polymerase III subunit gamma/tau [Candidatus Omnitrophota bacterium]